MLSVSEFMELNYTDMWYALCSASWDWICDLGEVLESYENHPNFANAEKLMLKRVDELERRAEDDVYQEHLARHVTHINLNFTDKNGNNVGSWGEGSNIVKKIMGKK